MQNEQNENFSTQTENSVETTEKISNDIDGNNRAKEKDIVVIQQLIAQNVSDLCYRKQDVKEVSECVMNLFKTTCALSAMEEFQTQLLIGDQAYRIGEYEAPERWLGLLAPSRVVASDVVSAFDFVKRDTYRLAKGQILDPESFRKAWKKVTKSLRVNPSYQRVQRIDSMLLSEATKFAVNHKRVVDAKQSRIIFLSQKFDEEAVVNWERWAIAFANTLFE